MVKHKSQIILKSNACDGKHVWHTKEDAEKTLNKDRELGKLTVDLDIYQCPFCSKWHRSKKETVKSLSQINLIPEKEEISLAREIQRNSTIVDSGTKLYIVFLKRHMNIRGLKPMEVSQMLTKGEAEIIGYKAYEEKGWTDLKGNINFDLNIHNKQLPYKIVLRTSAISTWNKNIDKWLNKEKYLPEINPKEVIKTKETKAKEDIKYEELLLKVWSMLSDNKPRNYIHGYLDATMEKL